MFQVVARQGELIYCLLTLPKCYLGELDNAMFPVAESYLEVIFYYLTKPKCD